MLIYGVVHLKSLPGSPSNRISLDEIIDHAQEDVNNLIFGGVDGIIIENFGDTPFVKDDISKRTLANFTTVVENLSIDKDIIHKGIQNNSTKQVFRLEQNILVDEAELTNGILKIKLYKKDMQVSPRKIIEINEE